MPKSDPETYVHGSEREGWWWGCTHCHCRPSPNGFVFKREAHAAASKHRAEHPDIAWDTKRSLQW